MSLYTSTFRALRIAAVVALVVITGCSKDREDQRGVARGNVSRPELRSSADTTLTSPPQSIDSLRDDFVEHGLLVSDSRLQVAVRLGQPDSTAAHSVILQTAMVSDNRYLKYPQLGIGTPGVTILQSLGEPGNRESGKYRYDCARCIGEDSPAYFYFDRGRVQRIEYSFYLD